MTTPLPPLPPPVKELLEKAVRVVQLAGWLEKGREFIAEKTEEFLARKKK